ncbi:CPBP family intramembrane glutamic endopeptidase [Methanobrevibacter sp.]|uniref:CPBP family intramembrane glutamic endopeptidase n=1 Tax=Methanobrevibacter sp. TaxID=66852 RepID=UPI003890FF8C
MNIHKKFFSKIGFSYLALAIMALVFQIIIINIVFYSGSDLISDFNAVNILSAFCNYVLPLPIFLYMMKRIGKQKMEKNNIGITKFIKYFAITMTLMWAGNIIGQIITTFLGGIAQVEIQNPVQNLINSTDMWLNVVLISIIGPIFEEFIFRKILIDRTIKYGAYVSIITSAIIFGFFHGNLNQLFYAFLMGGFFAYVYIKTGNIIYTMLLHITANLMGSVVSLFLAQSALALASGGTNPVDWAIVGIYVIILVVSFFIGLLSLYNYKKAKFNGVKTKIGLDKPLKTIVLNYGMIFFLAFCIIEIIYQITM